ncbi:LacI family DNA-binding transcriptional regulator [Ruania alkalisoli]|uniref:LacI family DNA-binding transcriptional regulator n=1 Tax=Ruania alkalisoli TaxID=2779775 RepID=A0A7M1SZ34_9MICO|nr:LacI family DNA-binding transcriptional regulator [Ruania alkalisoli]QOR72761.1 LacI family DNA-binding transcriptional regulator [Ruania alkalisoli]
MADVARRAGVSVKTVSNVVNGYPHIRPATKEKVETALTELGYRMNVSARHLRIRRTGLITLAVPELSLPYFAELADAVIREADTHGLTVLIEQTGGRRDRELAVLSGSRRQLTDGVILSPLGLGQADRAAFEVDFPLVLLGERVFGAAADHVTMNNVAAARAATSYLLELGRRRIAVLGPDPADAATGSAGLRLDGYREALDSAGVPFDPALVVPATPWHRSAGSDSLGAFLDGGTPVDAVFAMNDALALGALYALHARGVDVPADVALVGFDDVDDVRYATPTLSSVAPGRDEIARTAVALLRSRLAGDGGPYVRVISEARVVARQSTGSAVEQVISVQPGSQVPADAPV